MVLFIDFKQAYDRIKRLKVMEVMRTIAKLKRLVMITLQETKCNTGN